MSIELIWWLTILAAFSLYGILSGIELGVALLRVEPRLSPRESARQVFTPRWEITNVLLVVGCAGLVLLSDEAFTAVVQATWPVLVIGFMALAVRAGLLVYLYGRKSASGGKLPNYAFAVSSLLVPLGLGSAGIYMATGQPFWQSSVGTTLFISVAVGLLALSAGFIYYIGGRHAPQGVVSISRFLNMALAGLLAIVLLGVLSGDNSHLLNLSYAYLAVIAAGVVLAQSVCMASSKEWQMWWFLVALALAAPFLLGLANYPYLIYPDVQLSAAFAI